MSDHLRASDLSKIGLEPSNQIHEIYKKYAVYYSPCGKIMAVPTIDKWGRHVTYAYADTCRAPLLLQYSYSVNYDLNGRFSYAMSSMGKSMHALVNGDNPPKHVTDHINRNKLDNRAVNLRFATFAQNAQNCDRKTSKSTSGFHGVSKENEGTGRTKQYRWRAGICVKGVSMNLGSFPTQEEAALRYDIYAIHFFGREAKTNDRLPEDVKDKIVIYGIPTGHEKPTKPVRDLPLYISDTAAGTFRFRKSREGCGNRGVFEKTVKTLEEAIKLKDEMLAKWAKEDEAKEMERRKHIVRNSQGIAVVYVKAKNGKEVYECAVDDAIWGEVSFYSWTLNRGGYAKARIGKRSYLMHRFVYEKITGTPIPSDLTTDHINGQKLDNRMESLRLSNKRLQSHNRQKYVNGLDRFKGVVFSEHSYLVIIEDKYYGSYKSEEEAARIANSIYSQLYGDKALLNVVPDTITTAANRLPREKITREYVENITLVKEMLHLIRVLGLNEKNGGPYNLEKVKGRHLLAIRNDILSNMFERQIGIHF